MSENQKQLFVQMQKKDQERFDKQTKQFEQKGYFITKDGKKSSELRVTKPKFKEHVMKPKKVVTPYANFVKHRFNYICKAEGPASVAKIAPLLSAEWNKLSDKDKKPFFDLSEYDRQRHDRELQ